MEEIEPLTWDPSLNLEPTDADHLHYPNFFGTSAAAPHAAGIAALLMSGSKKFRGTPMYSDEIKSLLQSTAIDMMATIGRDDTSGSGFIQAYAAMQHSVGPGRD